VDVSQTSRAVAARKERRPQINPAFVPTSQRQNPGESKALKSTRKPQHPGGGGGGARGFVFGGGGPPLLGIRGQAELAMGLPSCGLERWCAHRRENFRPSTLALRYNRLITRASRRGRKGGQGPGSITRPALRSPRRVNRGGAFPCRSSLDSHRGPPVSSSVRAWSLCKCVPRSHSVRGRSMGLEAEPPEAHRRPASLLLELLSK